MNIVIQMLLCFLLLSETENYIVWRFNSSLKKVKTKLNHFFKQVFTIHEFDESILYGSKLFETKRRLK
jgi:hypothetical protein